MDRTEPPPAHSESDNKLIIALDFGTTFSGIAYCFANQHDAQVVSIVDWPGAGGECTPKIPTLINYNDPSDKTKFSWGASVNNMQHNIVGVKLLLDPSQERPTYLPLGLVAEDLQRLPKKPVEVAADFIDAIYRHALSEISGVVPKEYFAICQKEFVLSVPAVWSDAAKNATLQAAKVAGISPVTLVKEPEAAALYTMHSLDFALTVGDAFVVCDAGGGTVDLISYEVASLTPSLQLTELVPGTGSMAGSLGLNQRFADAVKELVGDFEFDYLRKSKAFHLAEKSFEREVKRAFRGDPDEEYFINFPMASLDDDPDAGLEANCWRMTGRDLKAIFAPLVHDIQNLITDQVRSIKKKRPDCNLSGIFLVGGFGSSRYLKSCIQKQHPETQVLQPNDAWAAIVKGAALSKLPQKAAVVASSATKHYGTIAWCPYNPVEDVNVPLEWRPREGENFAERMTWYINIGDNIRREQRIKFAFYRSLDLDYTQNQLLFQDTLWECTLPKAPLHRRSSESIRRNCELKADLRCLSRDMFDRKTGVNGEEYYDVHYDLVVTVKSAVMEFSLEFNGKQIGSVKATFD